MTTYTAFTTLPDEASAYVVSDALEAIEPAPMGIGTFEIEDGSGRWEVGGYFTEAPDEAALALLAAATSATDFVVSKVPDTDWVAQVRRELTPVEAGRFVVHGSHDRAAVGWHQRGLEIEAAMAFGTGHHGTTLGCLLALGDMARDGLVPRHVADIGSGTGVLAMAAARLWPARVLATDIDTVAVATARANLRANGFGTAIPCVEAAGFRHAFIRAQAPFDLVVANILAGPLKRLAPDMVRHTVPGARLILSGILARQAAGVIALYAGHGITLEKKRQIGEWVTLTLQRY